MKRNILVILTLLACGLTACKPGSNQEKMETKLKIETTAGDIVVKLYNETPKHRDNFIKLAQEGTYNGTLFHRAAERIYTDLTAVNREIRKADLETLLKDEARIQAYVDAAFKEKFFHVDEKEQPEYNGTQLIHAKVIASYLKQLLRLDLAYTPFRMEGMELKVQETLDIETPAGRIRLNLGGTIDRLDKKGDTLRIVDYKTGGSPKKPESISQLFTRGQNRPGYIFQTFLYAAIVCRRQSLKVAPALLYIHKAASDTYTPIIEMGAPRQPKIPVTDFSEYDLEFRYQLNALLQEIFNPAIPFTQTEDDKRCAYCDFRGICHR